MILSDNETNIDLLNNEAIAKTIVTLILDSKEQPISIGIHGDWGAGKSSILKMVEEELSALEEEKVECIYFNSWKHQGFEDSKIVLMSTIVSELAEKKTLGAKADGILKKIWENINWMSAAKTVGKTAFSYATGLQTITIMSSVLDVLKKTTTDEKKVSEAVESISGYLKESKIADDTSSNTKFREFQKDFEDLLKETNIDKLVILVDDLDRCLPNVAIETLEAIKLFMFNKKTAFVIAADESMIRYAVKKHFPDFVDDNTFNVSHIFANKYLEKLIQVPFRIPALGEVESCIYITLLLVGTVLSFDNYNYQMLCAQGIERIKKPWAVKMFTIDDVKLVLKEDYHKVADKVMISTQISHILAKNTDGNPRKIKRFINMLILRYEIAKNRGFSDELDMKILAKMMLAEYYWPDFYKKLPNHLNANGVWQELPEILARISTKSKKNQGTSAEKDWINIDEIKQWLESKPEINNKDLRPYYYASKEKVDYLFKNAESNDLSEIVNLLFSDKIVITGEKDRIEKLSLSDAEQVLDVVAQKIMEDGHFGTKPSGIDGLIILVEEKPELEEKLVNFIDSIPVNKAGVWITQGWDSCISKRGEARIRLNSYFGRLEKDGNQIVKSTLSELKGK